MKSNPPSFAFETDTIKAISLKALILIAEKEKKGEEFEKERKGLEEEDQRMQRLGNKNGKND